MERRGVYRKGSQHHPRNINPYLLYRQHLKKWRFPATLILALLFVFGLAPGAGDDFKTSVLSSEKNAPHTQSSEQLRKTFMNGVKEVTSECDRFALTTCVQEGDALLAKLSQATESPQQQSHNVASFIARFQTELAWNSCKYDLGEAILSGHSFEKKTNAFLEHYGKVLETTEVQAELENFTQAVTALERFVEGCRSR